MIHRHNDNRTINMVNYLANSSSGTFAFYSFVEAVGNNYWCWLHDETYLCAVLVSKEPVERCVSDHGSLELEQINKGLLFPVLLRGSDNTSYVKRFRSRNSMLDWAFDVKKINVDADDSLLYYNS